MINKATAGVLALSLIAGPAYATSITEQPAKGRTVDFAKEDGKYVKEAFTFNLSNQVGLGADESGSAIAVNTVHSDGRFNFGGSSEGGAVKPCQPTPLTAGDDKDVVTPTDPLDGCVGVEGYTKPGG